MFRFQYGNRQRLLVRFFSRHQLLFHGAFSLFNRLLSSDLFESFGFGELTSCAQISLLLQKKCLKYRCELRIDSRFKVSFNARSTNVIDSPPTIEATVLENVANVAALSVSSNCDEHGDIQALTAPLILQASGSASSCDPPPASSANVSSMTPSLQYHH